tara:strand:- start:167 stop:679 length:513 start_codon:yes stop_codon:yes gene_type:complete
LAINYKNAFKKILDTLREILYNETKLKVHFDKGYHNRDTMYFNIMPNTSSVVSRFNGGSTREYSATIKYYLKKGNYDKHSHIDYLTDMGERVTRLFNDKSNATSTSDLFQGILSQFSESDATFGTQVAYTFHEGRIENITYDPSRDDTEELDELHIVEFEFLAIVTEVFI